MYKARGGGKNSATPTRWAWGFENPPQEASLQGEPSLIGSVFDSFNGRVPSHWRGHGEGMEVLSWRFGPVMEFGFYPYSVDFTRVDSGFMRLGFSPLSSSSPQAATQQSEVTRQQNQFQGDCTEDDISPIPRPWSRLKGKVLLLLVLESRTRVRSWSHYHHHLLLLLQAFLLPCVPKASSVFFTRTTSSFFSPWGWLQHQITLITPTTTMVRVTTAVLHRVSLARTGETGKTTEEGTETGTWGDVTAGTTRPPYKEEEEEETDEEVGKKTGTRTGIPEPRIPRTKETGVSPEKKTESLCSRRKHSSTNVREHRRRDSRARENQTTRHARRRRRPTPRRRSS